MSDTVRIQVIFEEKISGTTFRDAIYYDSIEDYDMAVISGAHEDEKDTRIAKFEDSINNPPVQIPPTKDELIAAKAELLIRVAELDAEIAKK